MSNPKLSKETTIAISLVITFVAAAFVLGGWWAEVSYRLHDVEDRQNHSELWQEKFAEFVLELKELTRDNERRLDLTGGGQ